MWKKFAKFIVLPLFMILVLGVIQYSRWMYQLGFMSSSHAKHEIIKLKINRASQYCSYAFHEIIGSKEIEGSMSGKGNTHFTPYWFEDIVIGSKNASYYYSEEEKIEYFVGICYILQREQLRSAQSTVSIFNKVTTSDMHLMIDKIDELEKTKYRQLLSEGMMDRCKISIEQHPNYLMK